MKAREQELKHLRELGRFVSEFKSGDRPDLYAATPPLEALKAIMSIAAGHSAEFSLMHVDVSHAYFHAKPLRLALVKMSAEDCSGKDKGKIGLLKKSMNCARDAASNWERDWQGHLANWGYELGRISRNFFHNNKRKTSGLTDGDDYVVTGTKESLLELKKQLESVYPVKASIIGAVSAKSIKALNRRIRWGETEMSYQHDPRHLDVLVESLGLENGNTVQTPIVDDVKDENPVQLDPEQSSRYRSHVARCLFFSQDRDTKFVVNELCQRMSDLGQQSITKLKQLVRYLKGKAMDPIVRTREHEFMGDSFLRLTLGWREGNEDIVKRGSCAPRTTLFESVQKKTENHRQKQCRSRTVCSSIGSIRSERL